MFRVDINFQTHSHLLLVVISRRATLGGLADVNYNALLLKVVTFRISSDFESMQNIVIVLFREDGGKVLGAMKARLDAEISRVGKNVLEKVNRSTMLGKFLGYFQSSSKSPFASSTIC